MPEPLTWREFLGDAQPLDYIVERDARNRLLEIACGKKLLEQGPYVFHVGRTRADWAKPTFKHLIVVTHNGTAIGFRYFGLAYLQPEHRGKGLGAELHVQLFLLAGSETWIERHVLKHPSVTPAGYSSLRKAYTTLIDRGHIYDPSNRSDMPFSGNTLSMRIHPENIRGK